MQSRRNTPFALQNQTHSGIPEKSAHLPDPLNQTHPEIPEKSTFLKFGKPEKAGESSIASQIIAHDRYRPHGSDFSKM
jgi:hypothetical protein